MEIDWENVKLEFLDSGDNENENGGDDSPNLSHETTLSAFEFDLDEVLERNEFDPAAFEKLMDIPDADALLNTEDEIIFDPDSLIEEVIDENIENSTDDLIEEIKEDPFDAIRNPLRRVKQIAEVAELPYFCDTCTLDFPSEAYLTRHMNTKKHKRALGMEQRGRKVNQKRKYVRKNSCKYQTVQTIPEAFSYDTTSSDVHSSDNESELHNEYFYMLDVMNKDFQTESARNFYETFGVVLDVETENLETIQQF